MIEQHSSTHDNQGDHQRSLSIINAGVSYYKETRLTTTKAGVMMTTNADRLTSYHFFTNLTG